MYMSRQFTIRALKIAGSFLKNSQKPQPALSNTITARILGVGTKAKVAVVLTLELYAKKTLSVKALDYFTEMR